MNQSSPVAAMQLFPMSLTIPYTNWWENEEKKRENSKQQVEKDQGSWIHDTHAYIYIHIYNNVLHTKRLESWTATTKPTTANRYFLFFCFFILRRFGLVDLMLCVSTVLCKIRRQNFVYFHQDKERTIQTKQFYYSPSYPSKPSSHPVS